MGKAIPAPPLAAASTFMRASGMARQGVVLWRWRGQGL